MEVDLRRKEKNREGNRIGRKDKKSVREIRSGINQSARKNKEASG